MTESAADVCVIGGGPAGSAVAVRLARLGHDVLVIESAAFPRAHVGESLAPSVLPLLDALGTRAAVEQAGFLRPSATLLRWAAGVEMPPSPTAGLQVDRAVFDHILLASARDAGVRILQPARVLSAARADGDWRLLIETPNGPTGASARIVVDAAGRRGCLRGRRRFVGPRTLALWAYWRNVPLAGSEARVEAGEHQWYWGAPLPDGRFVAAAFIDAADLRANAAQHGDRDRLYRALIARSELLRSCLDGIADTAVHTCDASPYIDEAAATEHAIKVGEAAFAIDPLSSQGVQTALGSALHAAAFVHTMLSRRGDTGLAVEFYSRSLRDAFAFHQRAAAASYAAALATHPSAFWQRRAVGAPSSPESPTPSSTLRNDSVVQLAPGVRVQAGPVLRGDFITAGRHVVLPDNRGSLAFLDDVELAPLLEAASHPTTLTRLLQAWTPRVSGGRAEALLQWLWANGVLGSGRNS